MPDPIQTSADCEALPLTGCPKNDLPDAASQLNYEQLRHLALQLMSKETQASTLTATSLVHGLYLKLVKHPDSADEAIPQWSMRFAAHAMRQILIDRARSRKSRTQLEAKHAQGLCNCVTAQEAIDIQAAEDLLEFEQALKELAERFPEHAEIVRLRVFGGATIVQVTELLGVSQSTVHRKWEFAKAWLARRLHNEFEENL